MNGRRACVLLVDDEPGPRFAIGRYLGRQRFSVVPAETCASAREQFLEHRPDVCVLDYLLPDGTALDLLDWIAEMSIEVPVIILTGHGTIDLAVEAIKRGAHQFLTKPVDLETLELIISRSIEGNRERRNYSAVTRRTVRSQPLDPFLGESPAILALKESAGRIARSDSPALIEGETGTGKTVLARWMHLNSRRASEPFIDLNCGGLTKEFLESELFGHEKGAFTGAIAAKQGLFETAHRGTIFLDEIGDMDPQVQPKVLKVIEEKRFRRIGSVRDVSVDVRLIAATHVDLESLARADQFRPDLYYRVSTLPIRVPPLRERVEDIPLLADYFLRQLSSDLAMPARGVSPAAMESLCGYGWPGNLRELRNVLERALIHSEGDTIEAVVLNLPNGGAEARPSDHLPESLEENERLYLERILLEESGRVECAADRLGVSRSTLYYKIKKLGIEIPR